MHTCPVPPSLGALLTGHIKRMACFPVSQALCLPSMGFEAPAHSPDKPACLASPPQSRTCRATTVMLWALCAQPVGLLSPWSHLNLCGCRAGDFCVTSPKLWGRGPRTAPHYPVNVRRLQRSKTLTATGQTPASQGPTCLGGRSFCPGVPGGLCLHWRRGQVGSRPLPYQTTGTEVV